MGTVVGGAKLLVLCVVAPVAGTPAIVVCRCSNCCVAFAACCVAAIVDVIEVETAAGLPPMLPTVVAVVRPTLVGAIVELFTCAMAGRNIQIHTH